MSAPSAARIEQAVVVGAGPNGLAAAIELARRGTQVAVIEGADTIGGGTRTRQLIDDDHWHDVCSAAHPLGIASPFFTSLPLARHGLEWIVPDLQLSHPLGGGRAVGLDLDIGKTVGWLGADGEAYRRLVAPLVSRLSDVLTGTLAPLQAAWRRPKIMMRFGLVAIRSVSQLAGGFETPSGRALMAGLGAHAMTRLDRPATGGVAVLLAAAAHGGGWPIARGGSQSIADALASQLVELGGSIETGRWVRSAGELPEEGAIFLNTSPAAAVVLAGERLGRRMDRRLRSWRHGPGSYKVDWILSEPIPWADELSPRAATVHVGGSYAEIAASEERAVAGQAPERPFVLVTQPSLFDASRAPKGHHIVWGYCHVPAGYRGDATAAIESQIERFAPGFGDTIVARHVMTAPDLEAYNPNYVAGDIAGGAFDLRQLLLRPRVGRNPYRIGDRVYLCSASTPPGAGVHGMCGYHAVDYARRHP